MGSGKSSLAESLALRTDLPVISLDTCRIDAWKEDPQAMPMRREKTAELKCLDLIRNSDQLIFESSGVSRFHTRALSEIARKDARVKVIKLTAPDWVLRKRVEARSREKIHVPFPYKTGTVGESISYMKEKLKNVNSDYKFNTGKMTAEEIAERLLSFADFP
ncbi:hypothetical protein FUAX_55630 (plasmid) [Fulvitalea axinellae]|uniref:Shikimate kinase n=2 Tax=Fulvitalea axinellae TaxID=1182444 RepID=A0AAU9CMG0_9BACT|nr:hypothetical protein FUAX_55630 [Fulvitalea axinellae]